MERSEETIFVEALEKPGEQRAAYLAEACAGDPQLRKNVESLLDAYVEGEFLESPARAIDATSDQPISEKPGTQIGPYKLLQKVGEGGMGVVFMAEQKEPVKRRVALKIIKPGMDTREVIARFEAERQALAMMDHPNIAKVLDAGQTDSGRPYFVMELVNGISVTQYCDEQHLAPKERLELFVPICQAVQHAHQKGIIHRDLKPSNILIALYDGEAVPKIIDFGVAKATSQTLTEKTMFTQLGQVVGTLEYMSPEQAQRNQLDIDTRSDIYSLGVVLYELFTGDTPFDRQRLRSAAFDEMLRIIREEEPSKPSTKVSSSKSLPSIAANRRTEPARLESMIRGELDWIVMKALEKDRGRRYETASAFAEDILRYLRDEAIQACPPSRRYVLKKLIRRHKSAFAMATAVAAALGVGIVLACWQAMVATHARNRAIEAEQSAVGAERRANRNLQGALAAVDRMLVRVGDEKLKNLPHLEKVRYRLLQDAVRLYDRLLEDAPEDPSLQTEIAVTERRKAGVLWLLGRRDEARESISRSLKLLRGMHADTPHGRQLLQLELARSLLLAAEITRELEPLERGVAILQQVNASGPADRDAMLELANALNKCGMRLEEFGRQKRAEQVLRDAERLFAAVLLRYENDHDLTVAYAKHLVNFGAFHANYGKWQAEQIKLNAALELCQSRIVQRRQPDDLMVYASVLLNLGNANYQLRRHSGSKGGGGDKTAHADPDKFYQRSIEVFRELVRDYPAVPLYRERLASGLGMRAWVNDDHDLVTRLNDEALQILDDLVKDYPTISEYSRTYGAMLSNAAERMLRRDPKRAEQLARQAIEQQTRSLQASSNDPRTMQFLATHHVVLAKILIKQRRNPAEVADVCTKGLQIGDRLQQRYPENKSVARITRVLRKWKRAAAQATSKSRSRR